MFGLKPISGLGTNATEAIFEHRPFASLEDFVERMVTTKLVSDAKIVTLVKAGCFDRLCGIKSPKERRQLMVSLVRMLVPARDKITMVQLPKIIDNVPEGFEKELAWYETRSKLFGRNKIPMTKEFEKELLSGGYIKGMDYSFVGDKLKIDQKEFDKRYKKSIEALQDWVKTSEALDEFNRYQLREFW